MLKLVKAGILLDTHVLIWLRLGSVKLGSKARALIDRQWQSGQIYVSAITFRELSLLRQKNKIKFLPDIELWYRAVREQGLKEVAIDGKIAIKSVQLQNLPRDPDDRIIVATAQEGYQLITADQKILDWTGKLNSLDARL